MRGVIKNPTVEYGVLGVVFHCNILLYLVLFLRYSTSNNGAIGVIGGHWKWHNLMPRDVMHERDLYAVVRCFSIRPHVPNVLLSVCLSVTFVYCVERSWLNRIFKFFSLSGNTPFWFLHSKPWQYSDGEPLTEAEIAIFDLALELMTGRVSRRRPWNGGKIHCTKRSRPFIMQTVTHPWILFMTSNVDGYVEENKTEFNSTHW